MSFTNWWRDYAYSNSIYRSKIDLVSVHHEMFAGVAADSYARISKNRCGNYTTGPGLAISYFSCCFLSR